MVVVSDLCNATAYHLVALRPNGHGQHPWKTDTFGIDTFLRERIRVRVGTYIPLKTANTILKRGRCRSCVAGTMPRSLICTSSVLSSM